MEILKDGSSAPGCYAKLQNASDAACPIHSTEVASMKFAVSKHNATQETNNVMHRFVKFPPVTCESALFWPFINCTWHPNITYFPNMPPSTCQGQPIGYAPPLVQPTLPPVVDLFPPPAPLPSRPYLPRARYVPPTLSPLIPAFGSIPSPQPHLNFKAPPPQLPPRVPVSPSPQNPPIFSPNAPSPQNLHPTSPPPPLALSIPPPQLSPTVPASPAHKTHHNLHSKSHHHQQAQPSIGLSHLQKHFAQTLSTPPILAPNAHSPQNPYPTSPPSSLALSNPPNPIPRAPPVPKLPPVPTVPRKY